MSTDRKTPTSPATDHQPADGRRRWRRGQPLRTLLLMIGMPWWSQLGITTLHFCKQLPILLGPLFVAEVVRVLTEQQRFGADYFWTICLGFLVLMALNIPFHAWFVRVTSRQVRALEFRLRDSLVRHLQQLEIGYHNDSETGRLQAKVLRDVDQAIMLARQLFQNGLAVAIGIIWALSITIATEPPAAFVFLVLAPLSALVVIRFRARMRARNRAFRRRVETMAARVSDMIQLIPVTRAHGLEDYEIANVQTHLDEVEDEGRRVDLVNGWFQASAWFTMQGSLRLIFIGCAWLCWLGHMSIAEVILYNGLFAMIVQQLNQLINMYPQLSKGMESVESLGEILECPDIEWNRERRPVERVAGAIAFEDVTFHYDASERAAVERFSLRVQPGECIAVVGESGSGKSTLMNLTIGFWRPTAGRILLDGQAQEELDLRSWRRHVAVVPQQTILFSGSLRENITYGLEDYTDAQVAAVIEAANLREVVADLPQGLDTPIGENGVKLSGGQRQRVAIARALIRDPRIIILDEATSALDVISEREVQEAIDRLIAGRTTFIVAHRLSTIRRADRVVVMKGGRCAECGEQTELERAGGEFAALKALQG